MKIVKGNFSGSGSQKKNLQKQPNDIRANNGDAGYPDMILDLLKPYLGDKPDFEDVGDLMQLCIVAWNMANIKFFIPPDFKRTFDKTMMDMNIKGKDLTMVKEIMAEKQHKYPD